MKPLGGSTTVREDECAALVLETVPQLMRLMRREMREGHATELSMPQFRTLRVLMRRPGMSLSDLAEKLGLTLASASKLIDVLVKHDLVQRESSTTDRRRIELQLTEAGHAKLDQVWQAARAALAARLSALDDEERMVVIQAMRALQSVIGAEQFTGVTHEA